MKKIVALDKAGKLNDFRAEMDMTYKIIGADGAEYGPVTLEELKSWVLEGRVAKATQVWRGDLSR